MKRSLIVLLTLVAILLCSTGMMAKNVYLEGYTLNNDKVELPQGLAKHAYSNGQTSPYIIVFGGPIEGEIKGQVESMGVNLIAYLPDFSFLALMTPEVAARVQTLNAIEEVMIYQPAYKIHSSLKDEKGNVKGEGEVMVNIVTFESEQANFEKEFKNVRATKVKADKGITVAKMDRKELAKVANMNSVLFIEEAVENVLFNDLGAGYMDVDDLWIQGYDGQGQTVGIADTGLDTGKNDSTMHLDFQGRITAIYALGRTTADDPHGHGTHVAGSVLGSGARSNGQFKGMAPAANLVFQSVLDSAGGLGGLPTDIGTLFTQSWNAGARIHTNSWGAAVGGAYNTNSVNADKYMWNNKDMIILFAAGNEGRNQYTGRLVYNSISAPGTAKNVITVGASESYRPEFAHPWADNPNEIAPFSSKGWTDDGRVKPDIVAPGTFILSTRSTKAADSAFWANYNSFYAYMGGTSMATPLTAGAVAVAREYMMANWGITPKSSLMKAALINGANDLGFGVPSQDQGWGRVSLTNTLTAKEYQFDNETVSLNTNGTKTYTYNVVAGTPLKITLVWTDYPSTTSAKKNLVNDLDLVVTAPNGTVYYGNDFSSPYNSAVDRTNNVENVFISAPVSGTYTVTVKGYNVPYGPQPFSIFASGNF